MDAQSTIRLRSGNRMPVIGLGTWQLTGPRATQAIFEALTVGYRMIDTSGDYGNQREVGEAIRRSGLNRDDVFVVTKVEETGDSYRSAQHNLSQLGLAYADLILIHRPPVQGPGAELWQGLIRAKQEGLTKDIGVSNYTIRLLRELAGQNDEKPVVNQIEWSPFGHSHTMLGYCREHQIALQAYTPLTQTRLLGNQTLADMARAQHKTPAQIILRWNLQHGVAPLPKASSREHLLENIDVFDFELTEDDMATLDNLNEHYSALSELSYIEE